MTQGTINAQDTAPGGRRRRLMAVAVAGLAVASMSAGSMSLALFTDQETVEGTFSSGSIVLDPAKVDGLTLTTSNMMPGDSVTDDVVVENDGSSQLRYSMSTASTNADSKDLRSQLTLSVKTADVLLGGCSLFDGTQLYSGVLGASTAAFGSSAPGSQAGDRNLAAAANETLCFRVTLPLTTGNGYQSASSTTTFTFDAEQTASNP